ncbi:MAG: hypothetical protein NUW01_06025, partial [Gemmatimonadaceae bacterium]|nr:hypothetical protein [Gemmatimonadaceae bacterium]
MTEMFCPARSPHNAPSLVEAVGEGKRIRRPRQQRQPGLDGAEQHLRARQTRQVDVRGEVIHQLT